MEQPGALSESEPAAWKEPVQARSRARVARILDAARDLSAQAGRLDLKMADVAARANVPIGSVYQYFPSRTALLARLFAREMEPIDEALKSGLSSARSCEDILQRIGQVMRAHVDMVRATPGLFVIWSSPVIDPVLQAADFENSRRNARVIAEAVLTFEKDRVDKAALERTALLICHLWGSVIRLSIMAADDQTGAGVIDQFVAMIEARFRELIGP